MIGFYEPAWISLEAKYYNIIYNQWKYYEITKKLELRLWGSTQKENLSGAAQGKYEEKMKNVERKRTEPRERWT